MIEHIDELLQMTEEEEYNLIEVYNDLPKVLYQLKSAKYEPYVKYDARCITNIKVKFRYKKLKKTITYNIVSQELSRQTLHSQTLVNTSDEFNRMTEEMFKFNKALFKETHKSKYSELDVQILDEMTEEEEYSLIEVYNDLPKVLYQLKSAKYEPYVKYDARCITNIKVKFRYKKLKKIITYNIVSQELSRQTLHSQTLVDTSNEFNRMTEEMFKFNKALFKETHKSKYSGLDVQILDEMTEEEEYNSIEVYNDLPKVLYQLKSAKYEPTYVKYDARCITNIKVKFRYRCITSIKVKFRYKKLKKTITCNIVSQELSRQTLHSQTLVNTSDEFNRMTEEMFKFNKALFKETHKSKYSELDVQILDEMRTIVPLGYFNQDVKEAKFDGSRFEQGLY